MFFIDCYVASFYLSVFPVFMIAKLIIFLYCTNIICAHIINTLVYYPFLLLQNVIDDGDSQPEMFHLA